MATRTDADWLTLNRAVIEEFRANAGECGGAFKGNPMVLLTTTGARSGKPRTSPITYTTTGEHNDQWVLIASKAGADSHPAWYHNLVAHPEVTIEVGPHRYRGLARVAEEPERSRLFAERVAVMARFGGYVDMTERLIPVVVVEATGPA